MSCFRFSSVAAKISLSGLVSGWPTIERFHSPGQQLLLCTLGDTGRAVSRVGKKGATKVFKQGSDEDGSYANLSEKKEVFTPTGLVWDTNMAAVLLFWDSSMTDVTSRENSLLLVIC